MPAVQLSSATAPFSMVGLGQISQFEISGEGLRHLIGASQIHLGDGFLRFAHEVGSGSLRWTMACGLAVFNQEPAELLDRFEQIVSCLLDQRLPEDRA